MCLKGMVNLAIYMKCPEQLADTNGDENKRA